MAAPIHTEERFEDEVCEHLKASGWLFDGPLPYVKGYAYDSGYDSENAWKRLSALGFGTGLRSKLPLALPGGEGGDFFGLFRSQTARLPRFLRGHNQMNKINQMGRFIHMDQCDGR